jgi:hypothetical protein
MLFALVLGLLLGGAAVALLGQWRGGALTGPPPRRPLRRPALPAPQLARVEGLFLDGAPAHAGRRRSAT